MVISLIKGEKINLSKKDPSLSKITVGLGWDPIKPKGFFESLFAFDFREEFDYDCDASVLMLNKEGKIDDKKDVVYYGNLSSSDGCIKHTGDNLTGESDEDTDNDDEEIRVNLDKIPYKYKKILFVVTIYDAIKRRQDFGKISNAYMRIINNDTKKEILKYNLAEKFNGKTVIIFGSLDRVEDREWKFTAVGESTEDSSLKEFVETYFKKTKSNKKNRK